MNQQLSFIRQLVLDRCEDGWSMKWNNVDIKSIENGRFTNSNVVVEWGKYF